MTPELIVQRDEAALVLTLNRPQARNALSRAVIAELTRQVHAAAADADVRSIILTGQPPAFSSGLDLREVAGSTPAEAEQDAASLLAMFEALDGCPKPIIAAVNGPAVAGGAGLASVCDLVLMARGAVIGYPEIKRGLIAAIVMTYLRRLVGERAAKYLLLTGESVSAEAAVGLGLATEVVEPEELLPRARRYAAQFAGYPPQALAATKALWNRIRPLPHAAAVAAACELNAAMRTSAEGRSQIGAFLNK